MNKSVTNALRVFECLVSGEFAEKTALEVCEATSIPFTTCWRLLKTMHAQGWVVETTVPGGKQGRWKVSRRLVEIAEAYEAAAVRRVQTIRNEYHSITGKELKA